MDTTLILTGLALVAVLTQLTTEAVKTICTKVNTEYASNVIAAVSAVLISVAVAVGYAVINGIAIGANYIISAVALCYLSFLAATLGYDKVIQALAQISVKTDEED